jgi:APA family basic amino acid/polyamine antiporter
MLASVVLLSVAASLLALLIMAPRLYVAMARDGVLPCRLARTVAGSDHSAGATLLVAGIGATYALLGTFEQIVAFFFCTALAFVALAAAGLVVLRRREGSAPTPVFRCPGHPLVPGAFVLLLVVVIAVVGMARPIQAVGGFAIVLLGLPAYRLLEWGGPPERRGCQEAQS